MDEKWVTGNKFFFDNLFDKKPPCRKQKKGAPNDFLENRNKIKPRSRILIHIDRVAGREKGLGSIHGLQKTDGKKFTGISAFFSKKILEFFQKGFVFHTSMFFSVSFALLDGIPHEMGNGEKLLSKR